MSLKCPHCSYDNPDGAAFCQSCKNMLQPGTAFVAPSQPLNSPPPSTPPQQAYHQQQQFSPPPGQPGYTPNQGNVPPGAQSAYVPFTPPTLVVPTQMGTLAGSKQIFGRRAFAGRGKVIKHYSWLLNGEQGKSESIFQATLDILFRRQQNIQGLIVESKQIIDSSIRADQDEKRLYIVLKRGVTTVFLYIAPVGPNLYVSRASSVLPLISLLRAAILVIGALANIVVVAGYASIAANTANAAATGASPDILSVLFSFLIVALSSLFAAFCFWLPVSILLIPSLANAIKEGDFWVYLRKNTLTSFQIDDEVVLRHLVDYVLGAAVEHVGLNPDLVAPPRDSYNGSQKVRVI